MCGPCPADQSQNRRLVKAKVHGETLLVEWLPMNFYIQQSCLSKMQGTVQERENSDVKEGILK